MNAEFPKLKNKLILAPMEDVTNLAFRLLIRKYSDVMAYTEQISSIALLNNNEKSVKRAETNEEDKPNGLQLFGRNPESLLEAGKRFGKKFDVIDLNFGCPSKKIVSHGYGSALLKEKEKVFEIVSVLSSNLKNVTVKMRSGFKKDEALELVKIIEKAGASAVCIHARTQEQKYSGKADWSVIKKVKDNVSIPVIGNGDVKNLKDVEEMLKICDYCMIGRSARDNPLIFKKILKNEDVSFSVEERKKVFDDYFELEDNVKLLKLRGCDWSKGLVNGNKLRVELQRCKNKGEVRNVFEKI